MLSDQIGEEISLLIEGLGFVTSNISLEVSVQYNLSETYRKGRD